MGYPLDDPYINYLREKYKYWYTRIEHIDRIRTAYIMYRDIPIGTITEEYSSLSGESDWVIRPIWENWELCKTKYNYIVDIAGIDDTNRKDEYIRRYIPAFVEQRTIPDGREDLPQMLRDMQLTHYDRFEFMCRSHSVCGNDPYYVSRTPDSIIDVNKGPWPYEIPDFDTTEYGWLKEPIEN